MIRAVVFDLDNTLVDFMRMKRNAVEAGVSAMIDAGLRSSKQEIDETIKSIYPPPNVRAPALARARATSTTAITPRSHH